jgi:hypothetical protein
MHLALVELLAERMELLLALRQRAFTTLDRGALQLHGAQFLTTPRKLGFGLRQGSLPFGQAAQEVRELGLARFEVRRAKAEHPLDRGARVAQKLLAAFELGNRLAKSAGVLVELLASPGEQLLEPLLGARALVQDASDETATARLAVLFLVLVIVLIGARHPGLIAAPGCAGGTILSRRVRSDPPARRDFGGAPTTPAVT